jgi:hypothetical protein
MNKRSRGWFESHHCEAYQDNSIPNKRMLISSAHLETTLRNEILPPLNSLFPPCNNIYDENHWCKNQNVGKYTQIDKYMHEHTSISEKLVPLETAHHYPWQCNSWIFTKTAYEDQTEQNVVLLRTPTRAHEVSITTPSRNVDVTIKKGKMARFVIHQMKQIKQQGMTEAEMSALFEKEGEEFNNALSVILPVRVLAHRLGLHHDPHKSWRYRDIKRLLFDNLNEEHLEFIRQYPEHNILIQRLPNRLTMEHFCKRILLLAFHFILKDGCKPKFWQKEKVRKDLIERVLKVTCPDFLEKVNPKVAVHANLLVSEGMKVEAAVRKAEMTKSATSLSNDSNINL